MLYPLLSVCIASMAIVSFFFLPLNFSGPGKGAVLPDPMLAIKAAKTSRKSTTLIHGQNTLHVLLVWFSQILIPELLNANRANASQSPCHRRLRHFRNFINCVVCHAIPQDTHWASYSLQAVDTRFSRASTFPLNSGICSRVLNTFSETGLGTLYCLANVASLYRTGLPSTPK